MNIVEFGRTEKTGDLYVDRFEAIEALLIEKNGNKIELTGDECRILYEHLKPPRG